MCTVMLSLAPDVRIEPGSDPGSGLLPIRTVGRAGGYDVGQAPPGLLGWLDRLADGLAADSVTDGLPLSLWPVAYAVLERLNGVGALMTSVQRVASETPMVSVIPDRFATRPVTAPPVPAAGLRPSPHMLLRHEAGLWMAEQPGLGVVVRFHDPTAVRLLTDWPALHPADLDEGERAVVAALLDNGLLTPITSSVQPRSVSPEDLWEFHDYYFHHRARPGHYHAKYGGTYRFLDEVDPPPVVKAAMSEDRVPLAEGEPLAMPFGKVRAQRRSVRHDDGPLTVVELGEFLGHVARLRGFANSTHDQVSRRNYPGGGARYELEIYPLVHDVEGLPAGSYHYDPQAHELERIGNATAAVQASLAFAGRVATRRTPPRVLFVITARIGRVSWKYESIAYSLVLKHVGVLYSVMYDTATAMGLSPCALGAGNLDYYALATTTDPILEPAVGEFILGGAPMAMPDLRAR